MDFLNLLKQNKFIFDKAYGQNFVVDRVLLDDIVKDSGICEHDNVLEIGTGAGTLTSAIAKVAKKVVTVEIDESLKKIHDTTLKDSHNVTVVYGDFLKLDKRELVYNPYKVVANIPYYITTPIIFDLLESDNCPLSITLMVQKEVALRLVALPRTPDYGALSCTVQLYTDPIITRFVKKEYFTPQPKVDSAIVNMQVSKKVNDSNLKSVVRLIKSAFIMRRKTLVNNLLASYTLKKDQLVDILSQLGLNEKARGEELSVEQYIALNNLILSYSKKL